MLYRIAIVKAYGSAAYIGKLGYGFKPTVSVNITRWCIPDSPFQWDFEVDILGVILGLVNNDGWHEALPIIVGKDK